MRVLHGVNEGMIRTAEEACPAWLSDAEKWWEENVIDVAPVMTAINYRCNQRRATPSGHRATHTCVMTWRHHRCDTIYGPFTLVVSARLHTDHGSYSLWLELPLWSNLLIQHSIDYFIEYDWKRWRKWKQKPETESFENSSSKNYSSSLSLEYTKLSLPFPTELPTLPPPAMI